MIDPLGMASEFLSEYGWYIVGLGALGFVLWQLLHPEVKAMLERWEDAKYHKDPDKALARMEAIQRAREKQQQLLALSSEKSLELQKEREEKKRAEHLERLEKYTKANGGKRLGSADDNGYMPLSGGASSSSYRAPKRSACGGGGCGR